MISNLIVITPINGTALKITVWQMSASLASQRKNIIATLTSLANVAST